MNAQDPFTATTDGTLEDKVLGLCETILSCGLAIRGGQITAGGNMVAARNALNSFSDKEKKILTESYMKHEHSQLIGTALFSLMCAEAYFMPVQEVKKKYPDVIIPDTQAEMQKLALELVAKNYVSMKSTYGWQTDAKPLNWDLNAAGEKMFNYQEPDGLAKELVNAFDIGYKKPSQPQHKAGIK